MSKIPVFNLSNSLQSTLIDSLSVLNEDLKNDSIIA